MGKYQYSYDEKDLDELIEKLNKGIIPAVPEDMLDEARLRYKEIQDELFDGDDEVLTEEEVKAYQEKIKKKVEETKHKAHKDDIKVMKLSEKQLARLKDEVETTIVRPYPSDYNLTDEERYGNEERAKLYDKFSKLKRVYRNPIEFRNAINVCREVIKDSLDNDYPGMSKDEVYEMFHQGKIKVMIPIPRLFSDYVHEIKDINMKVGIINGDITLMSKSDIEDELVIDERENDTTEDVDFEVIQPESYDAMLNAHRKGMRTPLDQVFDNRNKVYNQLSIPTGNMFARIIGGDKRKSNEPLRFDFFQEDAARKYHEMLHDIDPYDPNEIARQMNYAYDNKLPLNVRNAIIDGSKVYIDRNDCKPKPVFEEETFLHPKDDNVVELEKAILEAIQSTN
jgi:hypothetical protein